MRYLLMIAGLLVVLITLYDIFHQLVHPAGKGRISHSLIRLIWVVFRRVARWKRSALVLAGPVAFVTVMVSWASLLACGWALVYWAFLPAGFSFSPGLEGTNNDGFADALYLSLVSLATLGYGDIVPRFTGLRVLASLQALIGFALLSAGITWLLSLYPALLRMRSFAQSVDLLRRAEKNKHTNLAALDSSSMAGVLLEHASKLATLRNQLTQFPIAYYFATAERMNSLAAGLPWLLEFADRQRSPDSPPPVRAAAEILRLAIGDFAATLGEAFLGIREMPPDQVLGRYMEDHLHVPGTEHL
jgi:hypothetical protein